MNTLDVIAVSEPQEVHPTPKHNQYDSVFRCLFHRKKELLELYNAVSGREYMDTEELEINTLSNAIYITTRNDVSFVMDFQMHLYEHQSTVNPNMPLRDLLYITQLYTKDLDIRQVYSSRAMQLPSPKFLVFYNGKDEMPEYLEYHLSDLYHPVPETIDLELRVRVININPGHNEDLLERSPSLRGYQIYASKVRRYSAQMTLKQAVERAVSECIQEDVLKEFLLENKREVMDMSIFEFDQNLYLEVQKEEAREDGIRIGEQRGLAQGLERGLSQGLSQGLERGEERLSSLNQLLLSERRYDVMERVATDREYRHSLYKQYGIA